MAAGYRTGNSVIRSTDDENHALEPNMKWIGSPVAEIWPFKYSKTTAGRHLEFVRAGNSAMAILSANPENHT